MIASDGISSQLVLLTYELTMNSAHARRQAEQLFSRRSSARTTVNEYEARSREVRRKIEYLRQLRLSAQARRAQEAHRSS
jgi:hypothetical protein